MPNEVTKINFLTCGVKPKGELFLRASALLNSEKSKTELKQKKNVQLEVVNRLIERYVECQKIKQV